MYFLLYDSIPVIFAGASELETLSDGWNLGLAKLGAYLTTGFSTCLGTLVLFSFSFKSLLSLTCTGFTALIGRFDGFGSCYGFFRGTDDPKAVDGLDGLWSSKATADLLSFMCLFKLS